MKRIKERIPAKKPTDEKEEEGEKGMSDFSSDCIAGQLDFDELRRRGYAP